MLLAWQQLMGIHHKSFNKYYAIIVQKGNITISLVRKTSDLSEYRILINGKCVVGCSSQRMVQLLE
jgi:hypothetical protein